MYCIYKDYMISFIEIGENNKGSYMYVDYYFKFSTKNKKDNIDNSDYIKFLSSIAFYFNIFNIKIFCEYSLCDIKSNNLAGDNYCLDYYRYFKSNYKKYEEIENLKELKTNFSYLFLDKLKTISYNKVLSKKDNDEVYQMFQEFKKIKNSEKLDEFYLWIIDNYCFLLNIFKNKLIRIYSQKNNPFINNDYYILDPMSYLYNRKLISSIPISNYKLKKNIKKDDILLPKNIYRL